MERVLATLLFILIVAVTGLGVVTWRADEHAQRGSARLLCVERAHATATIVLLTPSSRVDVDGRIKAIRTLSESVDAC